MSNTSKPRDELDARPGERTRYDLTGLRTKARNPLSQQAQVAQQRAAAAKSAADAGGGKSGKRRWEGDVTQNIDVEELNSDYVNERAPALLHIQQGGRGGTPWLRRSDVIAQEHYNRFADDVHAGTAMPPPGTGTSQQR